MTEKQKADELMTKFRNKKWVVLKVIDEILSVETLEVSILDAINKGFEATSSQEFWLNVKLLIINKEL